VCERERERKKKKERERERERKRERERESVSMTFCKKVVWVGGEEGWCVCHIYNEQQLGFEAGKTTYTQRKLHKKQARYTERKQYRQIASAIHR